MAQDTLEVIKRIEKNIKWIQKELVKLKKARKDHSLEKVHRVDSLIQQIQKELDGDHQKVNNETELLRNKLIRECLEKRLFVQLNRIPIINANVLKTSPQKALSSVAPQNPTPETQTRYSPRPRRSGRNTHHNPSKEVIIEELILPDDPEPLDPPLSPSYETELGFLELDDNDTDYTPSLPDGNDQEASPPSLLEPPAEDHASPLESQSPEIYSIGQIKVEGELRNSPEKKLVVVEEEDCSICKKKLSGKLQLKHHILRFHSTKGKKKKRIRNKSDSKKKPCPQKGCNETFTKADLHSHMKSFHQIHIYHCKESGCTKVFYKREYLRKHMLKLHGSKSPPIYNMVECPLKNCSKKVVQSSLELHSLSHKIPNFQECWRKRLCPVCGKDFTQNHYHTYKRHILAHCDMKKFQCPQCSKEFISKRYLSHHQKVHKGETFVCDKCPLTYNSQYALNLHLQNKHAPFMCPHAICYKKTFASQENLNKHLELMHNAQEVCQYCGKSGSLKDLRIHMDKIHPVLPCLANGCGKEFRTLGSFSDHVKCHDPESLPKLICEICGLFYHSKHQLKIHMRKCSKKSKYKCSFEGCEMTFSDSSLLAKHEERHRKNIQKQEELKKSSGVTYPCPECGKIYSQSQSLRFHQRSVHAHEDWVCEAPECGKCFKTQRELTMHAESHTTVRHQCPHCVATYNTSMILQRHVLNFHKKERNMPFKCRVEGCGESFYRNKYLENHMEKVHK